MTATPSRPRDVVFAGALTIMGSVLALSGIFSAQGQLRSSEVRRQIETLLADDRLAAVDLSVDAMLNLLEYGLMAASAASVAAIVLAVFVMRRHNPSRIALTVLGGLAALLLLLQWPTGLVIALFVTYTVSLLWRAPVRGWFAAADPEGGGAAESGRGSGTWAVSGSEGDPEPRPQADPGRDPAGVPGREPDDQPGREPDDQPGRNPDAVPDPDPRWPGDPAQPPEAGGPGPYPQPWPAGPPYQQPAPDQGYGYPPPYPPGHPSAQPPTQPSAQGPGHPSAGGYPGYSGYPAYSGYPGYPPAASDPHRRPGQVIAAHVLTWIGTAFGLLTGVSVVLFLADPQIVNMIFEQMPPPEGMTRDEFVTQTRRDSAVLAAVSLVVLVVSVFSFRRANWAVIALTVIGGLYMLFRVAGLLLLGDVAGLFTIVWVAAVVVLLWWPTSRQWYAAGRRPQGPYGPPGSTGGVPPYQPPPPRQRNQPW